MQIPSKSIKLLLWSSCLALLGALSAQAFSGNYEIQCEASGLDVVVQGASTANGAVIFQYPWGSGTTNEQWSFVATSNGYYQIKNANSGLDLVVQSASTANGGKIIQWSFGSSGNDQWLPVQNSDGSYTFTNLHSGKVLDDPGSSTAQGTQFDQWSSNSGSNQKFKLISHSGGGGGGSGFGSIVSQTQFTKMFPNANQFYTYSALVSACAKYPAFCTSGNATQNAQEAAAALANFAHETGGLVYINEIAQAAYCSGTSTPCGVCASGQEYYGRGPIQISWNYNYCACGQAIGQNLWANPNLVSSNATIAWQTGLWYWMTQTGGSSQTSHQAILGGSFGGTIKAINGGIECNGGNPAEVQDRLNYYNSFLQILGVSAGSTATGC